MTTGMSSLQFGLVLRQQKAIENTCTSRKINKNSDNILENLESVWEADEPLLFDNDIQTHEISDNESSEEEQSSSLKRSADVNPTPKFVDNKRKKMEKQLSSKQQEMVMINDAIKEIELKTIITQGLLVVIDCHLGDPRGLNPWSAVQ